jgi:hypothetical protein
MATASSALIGTTEKQKAEAANFEAFRRAEPNFAGRPIISVQWGGDPPDVLCLDGTGACIGVELVQWVNGEQIAASKKQYALERSYNEIIQSATVRPPPYVSMIVIYSKRPLLLDDGPAFRKELYDFIRHAAAKYPEWEDPQGFLFTDLSNYPCLSTHLEGLDFYSTLRRSSAQLGVDWIVFRNHGGAYTPDWMRDALLDSVRRKAAKYAKPHNRLKLEQQGLSEFYLLAYYDEAVLHNTPYDAPGFGFTEIGATLTAELGANPHPFDKVFVYSPLETPKVLRAWPMD